MYQTEMALKRQTLQIASLQQHVFFLLPDKDLQQDHAPLHLQHVYGRNDSGSDLQPCRDRHKSTDVVLLPVPQPVRNASSGKPYTTVRSYSLRHFHVTHPGALAHLLTHTSCFDLRMNSIADGVTEGRFSKVVG